MALGQQLVALPSALFSPCSMQSAAWALAVSAQPSPCRSPRSISSAALRYSLQPQPARGR